MFLHFFAKSLAYPTDNCNIISLKSFINYFNLAGMLIFMLLAAE